LIPPRLIVADVHEDTVLPRYLGTRDEVWVRAIVAELDGCVGRPAAEVEAHLAACGARLASMHGIAGRVMAGIRHELAGTWCWRVESRIPPVLARRQLFHAGARSEGPVRLGAPARSAAIDEASAALGVTGEELLASLFADWPRARRLVAPAQIPSASDVVDRYNLSLLQALVARSTSVTIRVRELLRSVVRYAKLQRLICSFESADGITALCLSGPLSLFRQTTKYGRALAQFVPSAMSTVGWSLEATCAFDSRLLKLRADATDRLARGHALPRDADSAVEAALVRDVRRLGEGWTLDREPACVQANGALAFPDFYLGHGDTGILVEVVGFYTPEYLERKMRLFEAMRGTPLIVCIDEALACGRDDIVASGVLRYRKRIDARALLALADQVMRRSLRADTRGRAL
jgi:predicted nuclease of restriction endonuclease-like RecB superfamily